MANIQNPVQDRVQDHYKMFHRNLQWYQINREKLIDLILRSQAIFKKLNIDSWVTNLSQLNDKVRSNRFKIMVVGEFKRGKSTFINAMFGEEILPAYSIPCTAVINEIKWGEEKKATLYFRNPLPDPLPEKISERSMDHIQKWKGVDIPPMDVPVDKLEDYVAIPDPEKNQSESVAKTPYEKIELFWPLNLLEDGVEIIDSPGLNEAVIRSKITMDYIPYADVILFVISCTSPVGVTEIECIDMDIRGAGHEDIFFIFNRFDDLKTQKDRDKVVSYGQNMLKNKTSLGIEGIFFISSYDALTGRLEKDDLKIEKSGILKLEEALARFLNNERGKVKLLQPIRGLTNAIHDLRSEIIPNRRGMLDKDLEYIEKKYQQLKPQLDDAERSRRLIIENLRLSRDGLRREVKDISEEKLLEIADKIPSYIEGIKTETEIKLLTFKQQEQAEALVNEIVIKTKDIIDHELYDWKEKTLIPLVNQKLENMVVAIKDSVDNFYTNIDKISADFSDITCEKTELGRKVSGMERLVASLGGLLLGDVISGTQGALWGFKGLAAGIATQISIAVVAIVVLGVTNPFVIIGALLGGGILTGIIKKDFMVDKAKKEIAKAMQTKFKSDIHSNIDKISESVYQQTGELEKATDNQLGQEINIRHEEIEAVLKDKRAGKVAVQAKKDMLIELEKEVNAIDGEFNDLIFALAGTAEINRDD